MISPKTSAETVSQREFFRASSVALLALLGGGGTYATTKKPLPSVAAGATGVVAGIPVGNLLAAKALAADAEDFLKSSYEHSRVKNSLNEYLTAAETKGLNLEPEMKERIEEVFTMALIYGDKFRNTEAYKILTATAKDVFGNDHLLWKPSPQMKDADFVTELPRKAKTLVDRLIQKVELYQQAIKISNAYQAGEFTEHELKAFQKRHAPQLNGAPTDDIARDLPKAVIAPTILEIRGVDFATGELTNGEVSLICRHSLLNKRQEGKFNYTVNLDYLRRLSQQLSSVDPVTLSLSLTKR